jgi:hypothetical protein
VRFDDFCTLIDRLARDVPAEFQAGIVAIAVSPKTVPHPVQGDVYTLGECIPLGWTGDGADLQSRIALYHGSFAALARQGDLDWRQEAWETLTHELRHHLEWRANHAALEAYDWAAEQNLARQENQPFDPAFYRSGECIAEGIYKVDDDVFIERRWKRGTEGGASIIWHGQRYRVPAFAPARGSLFVRLQALADPPAGDAVLVLTRRPRLRDLGRPAPATQRTATVEPIHD